MRRAPARAARRLLVECLLGLGARRDGLAALAAGAVDWRHLLRLARRHAIAEGAHLALERHGADVPEPFRTALRDDHALAAARNTVLLHEAARTQEALAAAGIESVLIKGAALLATLREHRGARHVGDVDVLVKPRDLGRACTIARASGCRLLAYEPLSYDGTPPLPAEEHHAPGLVTPLGATLELHGRAGHGEQTAAWTPHLLSRAVEVEWSGRKLRVPALDDQLAVLCVHVHEGHRGDRRLLPRHLGDVAALVAVGARFEAASSSPGALDAVRRSQELLEGAKDGRLASRQLFLRSGEVLLGGAAVLRQRLALARMHGGAWRLLLPSPRFMARRYGVADGSALVPLLYAWRPLRGAWRLVTGR